MAEARAEITRPIGLRLWLSAGWLIALVLTTLLAPVLAPQDPLAQDLFTSRLPPFWIDGSEPGYPLGSDSLGRDVLSRMMYGGRVALSVALIAGTLTCLLGASLGLIAGYFRGWPDIIISRLVDIWMAFPPVLFAILLIAVLGTGLTSIIIAIVVIDWTRFARVVRAEAIGPGSDGLRGLSTGCRPQAFRHYGARNSAQRPADHLRTVDAGNGDSCDCRSDTILR